MSRGGKTAVHPGDLHPGKPGLLAINFPRLMDAEAVPNKKQTTSQPKRTWFAKPFRTILETMINHTHMFHVNVGHYSMHGLC